MKQSLKEQTQHLQERLKKLEVERPRLQQSLLLLTKQSYDIFSTFGTEPEALENIYLGFMKVLERCTVEEVERAFDIWLHTRKVMPRPCNILKRCLPEYPSKDFSTANAEEVKEFLSENERVKQLRWFMTGGIDPDQIED